MAEGVKKRFRDWGTRLWAPAATACMLLCLEVLAFLDLRNGGVGAAAAAVQIALFIICAAALGVCWYLIRKRRAKAHTVFLIMALTLGLFVMLLVQPMTVPDEETHFRQSYRLSNVMLFQDANTMRAEDRQMLADLYYSSGETVSSIERYRGITGHAALSARLEGATALFDAQTDPVRTVPLGYVASAIGVSIARLLGLSGFCLFYAGRLFNLLAFAALFSLAIRITPRGKWAFAIAGLFPKMLQGSASYSYDGIVIGTAFLFVALVMKLREEPGASPRWMALCMIAGAFTVANKVSYCPMVLLLLLIPAENIGGRKKKAWFTVITVVLGLLLILYANSSVLRNLFSQGVLEKAAGTGTMENAASVSFYIHNPGRFIMLVAKTALLDLPGFMLTMVGSSMACVQVFCPPWIFCGMLLLFMIACQNPRDELAADGGAREKWLIVLILIISYLLILFPQMISNTSTDSTYISGVQGRYFLPWLCMMPMLLRTRHIQVSREIYPGLFIAQTVLTLVTLLLFPHYM